MPASPAKPELWPPRAQKAICPPMVGNNRHAVIVSCAAVKPTSQRASMRGQVGRLGPAVPGGLDGDVEVEWQPDALAAQERQCCK